VSAEPDRLTGMLARLGLKAMRDRLDNLLDEAGRRDLSVRDALDLLCEAEVRHREERRIQMGLGIAKFPFIRTLDGFDFEAQPSLDPKQVRDLASCRPAPSLTAPASRTEPPKAAGSPTAMPCSSSARPASARPISRSRSAARRSGSATRCCSWRRRRF
jgi:IstB-like ATP binding protein